MNLKIFFAALAVFAAAGCGNEAPADIPSWKDFQDGEEDVLPPVTPVPETGLHDFEKAHTEITAPCDMVLMYGGGHHRSPYRWSQDYAKDYVTYTDRDGVMHWLFDGFLFLEFMDAGTGGSGRTFITGYKHDGVYLPSATKTEWEMLADYYFYPGTGLDAVENAVAEAAKTLGEPPVKRKVVIGIPEPIVHQNSHESSGGTDYWGEIDGKKLDFTSKNDRIAALVWFIDRVRENFSRKEYSYIDLSGFYWVAEKATQTADLMPVVAGYLNEMNYSFNWIPYFNADGATNWKSYGFNYAYLQPNYFFNNSVPYSRLSSACKLARTHGMDMEVEFDGNALVSNSPNGQRLRDYMEVMKNEGVWESSRLAYYQGSYALRWLKYSNNTADQALYHDFCGWVTSRPIREKE